MLIVDRISYAYPSRKGNSSNAIDSVSFECESGSMVLLTGSTGSGKTTLLQLLCGLRRPQSGSVSFGSLDSPYRDSTMVFQYPEECFFNATVREEVLFSLKEGKMPGADDIYGKIMDPCGLDLAEYSSRSPLGLSGGEQRRVAFAAVIGLYRNMLLLDEPASGLDNEGIESIRGIVRSERAEKRTVFVSTHWPANFIDLASHVARLNAGRLEFFVTVDEYIDGELFPREMETKEGFMIAFYRSLGRFPVDDNELLNFARGVESC